MLRSDTTAAAVVEVEEVEAAAQPELSPLPQPASWRIALRTSDAPRRSHYHTDWGSASSPAPAAGGILVVDAEWDCADSGVGDWTCPVVLCRLLRMENRPLMACQGTPCDVLWCDVENATKGIGTEEAV